MKVASCLAALSICLAGCSGEVPAPPISEAQKAMIAADLQSANFPPPSSLEVNDSGFVVATFDGVDSSLVPDGGKAFAQTALIRIRERLLASGKYENFRVTVNGHSPGTGLISRYGSARFVEGGEVTWSQGK
jgi:hypothetical protein